MLIVDSALVGLTENLVGLLGLLELLFGLFITRIAVRVIFHGQATTRAYSPLPSASMSDFAGRLAVLAPGLHHEHVVDGHARDRVDALGS